MKVTLIASTALEFESVGQEITSPVERIMDYDPTATEADTLAEFAGRACYQSFGKPNEKTRANRDYLANILRQQHESVLEHASASFYVEGVSRNLLLELERHRHLSFSVVSQRYVDSSETEFVYPPAFGSGKGEAHSLADDVMYIAVDRYNELVEDFLKAGLGRKQAREAARSVLPGGIETKFVVTGNHRAWRDVLRKRFSVHADAEIQALAGEILVRLRLVAPHSFQDFPEFPFE